MSSPKAAFHPRNIHSKGYDFTRLTAFNPDLSEWVITLKGRQTIDFSNPNAVLSLNSSLLKAHYDIQYWSIPEQNLCPAVPSRVDYIHYIADLVSKEDKVRILDIGTGSSCIYPLLGTRVYGWQFVGSDIDSQSLGNAQRIIDKNNLGKQIILRKQLNAEYVLDGIVKDDDSFDVVICNPPFYRSEEDAQISNRRKTTNLKTPNGRNFSGRHNELICPGGEHRFLNRYLYESTAYAEQCKWFTALVSQKQTAKSLEKSAAKLGVDTFNVIQMKHGNKVSRLVIWSY